MGMAVGGSVAVKSRFVFSPKVVSTTFKEM